MWMSHSAMIFMLVASFPLQADSRRCGPRCFSKRNVLTFLHVSDIHFDPGYNQSMNEDTYCHSSDDSQPTADYEAPYGRIGCDSLEWLWDSALSAMKEKGKGAKFILLTGRQRSFHPSSPTRVEDENHSYVPYTV